MPEHDLKPGSVGDAALLPDGFLDRRHPEYTGQVARWNYVRDHYDDQRIYDELDAYLPMKRQGEHTEEYSERKALAHYPNLIGPVLDSFTGLLFHKEDEAEREWGQMGDPNSEGTLAAGLLQDADGRGTDHEAALKKACTALLMYQKVGLYIDTNKRPEDEGIMVGEARARNIRPRWKVVEPQAILDWLHDEDGRVVQLLVSEATDTRESLAAAEGSADEERFLWIGAEGWTRIARDEEAENGLRIVDEGTFGDPYLDTSDRPVPPLFVAELPLGRYPGYTLARSNNAIFNTLSEHRWLLRKGAFVKFVFSGSDTAFDDFTEKARTGVIAIQENLSTEENGRGHRFVSPDMDPADALLKLRVELVKDFWRQALYEFSDNATERTATEITADFVASIGAFLNILAGAMDEAENMVLRLVSQASGIEPDAYVRRTRAFGVVDSAHDALRLKAALFGEMGEIPLTPTLKSKAVARIATLLELVSNDEREQIEDELLREAELESDRMSLLEESFRQQTEPDTDGFDEAA